MDPQKIVREDRLREVFDMFDVDKSGAITVDEIKKILGGGGGGAGANLHLKPADTLKSQITQNLGGHMPSSQIHSPDVNLIDDSEWQGILGEVDANGDGEISFEEFVEMIFKLFGMKRAP
jgi:Ca2+-binding EF-hand superfamily protein